MTKERVIEIFQDYVNNDYEGCSDSTYIVDALYAVANEKEIRELGFDWVLDCIEEEDYKEDEE